MIILDRTRLIGSLRPMSIKRVFRSKTFETVIPRNISLAEASMNGIPAIFYAPEAAGSVAYKELAQEIIFLTEQY